MKRSLSILLCVVMVVTMLPVGVFAQAGGGLCANHPEHTDCGYIPSVAGVACDHVCSDSCATAPVTNCVHDHEALGCVWVDAVAPVSCGHSCADGSCGFRAASEDGTDPGAPCDFVHTDCGCAAEVPGYWACAHSCSEASGCVKQCCSHSCADGSCGYVQGSDGAPCTHSCELCGQTADKVVLAWTWVDPEAYLTEGELSLPGASEEAPASFDTVLSLLPAAIDTEEYGRLTVVFSCDDYPEEGAFEGSYLFTAALPQGYALAEDAEPLTVQVHLGGAELFWNDYSQVSGVWRYGYYFDGPSGDGAIIEGYTGSSISVTIPKTLGGLPVEAIGTYSFDGTSRVYPKNLTIPSYIVEIDESAFVNNGGLQSVTIQGAPVCRQKAFSACTSLTSVALGSITSISKQMFSGCTSLKSIQLPQTLRTIGYQGFAECPLESITIPESVTSIGEGAFWGSRFTEITIPRATRLDDGALAHSQNLQAIYAPADSYYYTSVDGVLYNSAKTELVAYPRARQGAAYVIPTGVTGIRAYAFTGYSTSSVTGSMSYLRKLYIPATVTTLAENAFMNDSIKEYYFCGDAPTSSNDPFWSAGPITVYYAQGRQGWGARFHGWPTAVWPAEDHATVDLGVTGPATCGEPAYTLMGCPRCDFTYKKPIEGSPATGDHSWSFTADEEADTIQASCSGCETVGTVSLVPPADCTYTGDPVTASVVNTVPGLATPTVTYTGGKVTPEGQAIAPGSYTATIVVENASVSLDFTVSLPEGATISGKCGDDAYWEYDPATGSMTVTGTGAMYDYALTDVPWEEFKTEIRSLRVEEGITIVGQSAFDGCTGLQSVALPSTLITVRNAAFSQCGGLTQIDLPDGLKNIEAGAFYGCAMTSVTVPAGVTALGDSAFMYCGSLSSVTLPQGLTTVGSSAFRYCGSLKTIDIPDTVTKLGSFSFANSGLTAFTFPDDVTTVGGSMFYQCYDLAEVTLPANAKTIDVAAFSFCRSLTEVVIPDGVTAIKSRAFQDCPNLTSVQLSADLETIGLGAFYNTGITELTIPAGVTSLDSQAFAGNSGMALTFEGPAPSFNSKTFDYSSGTVYYDGKKAGWDTAAGKDYGGSITWVDLSSAENACASVTVSGVTTPYATLTDAFAAANAADGSTLKLLKSVSVKGAGLTVTGSFTLDLNGNSLTDTYRDAIKVSPTGSLTVTDPIGGGFIKGTVSVGWYYGGGIVNEGTLILNGGTVTADGVNTPVAVLNRGSFTMNGGKLSGTNAFYATSGSVSFYGGTVASPMAVYGGTMVFHGGDFTGISGNGFIRGADVTIYGGSFGSLPLSEPGATVKVYGGTFSGQYSNGSSTTTLYGGSFLKGLRHSGDTIFNLLAEGYAFADGSGKLLEAGYLTATTEALTVVPRQPNAAIDFENEKLTGLLPGRVYSVNGQSVTAGADGTVPLDPSWLGSDITLILTPDAQWDQDSQAQILTVPGRPGRPEGVEAVPESEAGKQDGKLTGVTAHMEYRVSGGSWQSVTGTEITGLAPGSYEVRRKATETAFAGEAGSYTVAEGPALPVTVVPTIQPIPRQLYTGEAIVPEVLISFQPLAEGEALELGKDYLLTYSDNILPGIATVTLTALPGSGYTFPETHAEFTISLGVKLEGYDRVSLNGVTKELDGGILWLEEGETGLVTVYGYHDPGAEDPHLTYPTGMQVWSLTVDETGMPQLTREALLDNALQYAGTSIRITGNQGIRFITAVPSALRSTLIKGTEGYRLVEYGTLFGWYKNGADLRWDVNAKSIAYSRDAGTDAIFQTTGSAIQFTGMLTDLQLEQATEDLVARPYMVLERTAADGQTEQVVLYGGSLVRSIGYVAYQNKDVFKPGTDAYNFIWEILSYAYPDLYGSEFQEG